MKLEEEIRKCIDNLRNTLCLQNFSFSLSESEYRIIMLVTKALKKNELINLTFLSNELKVTRSAVTQLVNKLVEKKCLVKYSLPSNKKEVYLKLGGEAKFHYDRIANTFDEFYRRLHERIGDEGEKQFIHFINCVQEIAKELQEEEKEIA